MALAKTYALIRELNRPRHPATLWCLALAAYVCLLLTSGEHALGQEARRLVGSGRVKEGLRFVHWAVRRGWPGFTLYNDPTFQFATDLGQQASDALLRFTRRRSTKRPDHETSLDILDILARRGHDALRTQQPALFQRDLQAFGDQANRVLSELADEEIASSSFTRPGDVSQFSVKDASAALSDFHRLMQGGARWYAISGTLLGIVREGGWLSHDYDIDVGIHAETADFNSLLSTCAASTMFSVAAVHHQEVIECRGGKWTISAKPAMLKLVHRTGINLDVFIHHLDCGNRWHGSSMHRWGNSDFSLASYELNGVPVLGPAESETYLTENYGAEWRIPNKGFNALTDTPNLQVAPNLMSISLMLRKVMLLGGLNSEKGRNLLSLIERDGALALAADGWRFSPKILGADGDLGARS